MTSATGSSHSSSSCGQYLDGDSVMGPKQVLGHLGAAEKADWRSPKEVHTVLIAAALSLYLFS